MRQICFFLSILILSVVVAWTGLTGSPRTEPIQSIIQYLLIFVSGISVALLYPRNLSTAKNLLILLFLCAWIRLLLAPHETTDDINRYLWEGKITRHGINPYAITADQAPPNSIFRDFYWQQMNHKESKTAYPPLAILIFASIGMFSYSPILYKFFFVAMDMGIICLLLYWLHEKRMPLRLILFYALNPIILYSYAAEAHFDSLLVFFMILALTLRRKNFNNSAWFFLAIAIQIKVIAIIFMPLFLRKNGWRGIWAAGPPLLIPTLFFRNYIDGFFEGVLTFASQMAHNGSLHHVIRLATGSTEIASMITGCLLAISLLLIGFRIKSTLEAAALSTMALILLSPTIHFWYIAWVLPFLFFIPALPWLYLTMAMSFYYLTWHKLNTTGFWHLPGYIQAFQWLPFVFLMGWQYKYDIKRFLQFRKPYKTIFPPVSNVSIVIPSWKNDSASENFKSQLQLLKPAPLEIIQCLPDEEASIISSPENNQHSEVTLKTIYSQKGRGYQIAAGVAVAKGDAILVLHSDCFCDTDLIDKILTALNSNRTSAGGAVGQLFQSQKIPTILIECLNEFRVIFFRQSFGDQGQFFRKAFIDHIGSYPRQALMEDVEMSELIESQGNPIYLGGGIYSSARTWEKENWFQRVRKILSFVFLYRVNKLFGKNISENLYKKYYS